MGPPRDGETVDPVIEQLDAALKATCEALFALQVVGMATLDDGRPHLHLGEAMRSLRRAIVELRTVHGGLRPLAYGFVAPRGYELEADGE